MRRLIVLATAVAVAASLAGCTAAPLSAKLVETKVNVTAPADTLIGDSVKVIATAQLADKRTDKVTLRLQSSEDGTTWTTVSSTSHRGPSVTLTTVSKTTAAGNVQYRATVSATAKTSKPLATSSTSTVTTADIKTLVRKFYYDRTQAYSHSTKRGIAWDQLNDSAVYNRKAKTWISGWKLDQKYHSVETSVPDVSTIAPDPDWRLNKTTCNAAMTAAPAGRTFVVTTTFGGSYDGFPTAQEKADVHVTYSNGKLAHYIQGCRK